MARYECVDSQHNEPGNTNPVVKKCRWLQVSPSGFYHWRGRPQWATLIRRHASSARVQHFFEDSEESYGYRRIHADLVVKAVNVPRSWSSPSCGRVFLPDCHARFVSRQTPTLRRDGPHRTS
jgi:hypothetical protein